MEAQTVGKPPRAPAVGESDVDASPVGHDRRASLPHDEAPSPARPEPSQPNRERFAVVVELQAGVDDRQGPEVLTAAQPGHEVVFSRKPKGCLGPGPERPYGGEAAGEACPTRRRLGQPGPER